MDKYGKIKVVKLNEPRTVEMEKTFNITNIPD